MFLDGTDQFDQAYTLKGKNSKLLLAIKKRYSEIEHNEIVIS